MSVVAPCRNTWCSYLVSGIAKGMSVVVVVRGGGGGGEVLAAGGVGVGVGGGVCDVVGWVLCCWW